MNAPAPILSTIAGPSPFPGVTAVDYRNRDAWLEGRRRRIGSSDSAGIFGVGYADQSPLSVYASKVVPSTPEDSEATAKKLRIGLLIEPALRSICTAETGWPCSEVGQFSILEHPEIPWLGATLDGVIEHPEFGNLPWEGKNVDHFNKREWADDQPPLKFQVQVQHHMAVTGASHCVLFGLVGGNDPRVVLIERDERFIAAMLSVLSDFWGHVERREPPMGGRWEEFANHAAERSILAKLWVEAEGEEVDLPAEADSWHVNFEAAKVAKKAAEEEEARWGNKIRAAIGEATFGRLVSGQRYSFKTQNRKGYYVEPSSTRVLRACR